MNACYIFIYFCVILESTHSAEEYAGGKHNNKLKNVGRKETNRATAKQFQVLKILSRNIVDKLGSRQRREALDALDNYSLSAEEAYNESKGEEEEDAKEAQQMAPCYNSDFCKSGNCGGRSWSANRLKYSLNPAKELKMLLSQFIRENKKTPREVHLYNDEHERSGRDSKKTISLEESKNKLNTKSKNKNTLKSSKSKYEGQIKYYADDNYFSNEKNPQDSELLKNINLISAQQSAAISNSDLSSCEHCSQYAKEGSVRNNSKFNYNKNSRLHKVKLSKQPHKSEAVEPYFKGLEQTNSLDNAEYDDDEYDVLQIKYPSVFLVDNQKENKNEKHLTGLENSTECKNTTLKSPVLNDQLENIKNNLSHEAHYKLSKGEQDSSENKNQFTWKLGVMKRSHKFNAMNEIKLKTSKRLMEKGLGASLPSYSFGEPHRDLLIDNMLRRREKEMMREEKRKYTNLYEVNENSAEDANSRQLEDSVDTSLEPVLPSLPGKPWTWTRSKRVVNTKTRYKRELTKSRQNYDNNKEPKRSLNTFSSADVIGAPLKKGCSAGNQEILSNDGKTFTAERHIPAEQRKRTRKRCDIKMEESTFTQNFTATETAHSLLNEYKNKRKSSEFNTLNTGSLIGAAKKYTRASKASQLKIYENFHKPKALRSKSLNYGSSERHVQSDRRVRRKRWLEDNLLMVKNSAGNDNWVKKAAKKLQKIMQQMQINLKTVLKKSINYLRFEELRNKSASISMPDPNAMNCKFYDLKNNASRALNTTNYKILNNDQLAYEQLAKKSFALNTTKSSKHSFLREAVTNLFMLQHVFNKSRSQRSPRYSNTVPEMHTKNSSSSRFDFKANNMQQKTRQIKSLQARHLRFSKPITYKRGFKTIANSNEGSLTAAFDYIKNLFKSLKPKLNHFKIEKPVNSMKLENAAQNLETVLKHINFEIPNSTAKVDTNRDIKSNINVQHKVGEVEGHEKLKLEQPHMNLRFNKSFNDYRKSKLIERENKTESPLELWNNQTQKRENKLKRFKRSFSINLPQDFIKQNSFFPHYDNFYKADLQPDFSYKKSTNYFTDPLRRFQSKSDPATKRATKSMPNYNLESIHKSVMANQALPQKAYPLQFKNKWSEPKSPRKNFKRRLKTKTSSSYTKTRGIRKPDLFQNYTTSNKTSDLDLKSSNLPLEIKTLKDKYLNDLQNFHKNYKFQDNYINGLKMNLEGNSLLPTNTTRNNTTNLSLELHNAILNCKAFANLEEFIKSLPKNMTQFLMNSHTESSADSFTTDKIAIEMNTQQPITLEVPTTYLPPEMDHPESCSTTQEENDIEEEREEENKEENINETTSEAIDQTSFQTIDMDFEQTNESTTQEQVIEASSSSFPWENVTTEYVLPSGQMDRENVKLNITINAHVQGNPTNHHYTGNGSFDVVSGAMDDRHRREILLSSLGYTGQIERIENSTPKSSDNEDSEELNDLISGKLSANVVKLILNTVKESAQLRALWPSLEHNKQKENAAETNFYAIKNEQNRNELENSEKLLGQVMSSINTIIEQKVRSESCVPLRPDLQEFYNLIIQSGQQQDMMREKRQAIKES